MGLHQCGSVQQYLWSLPKRLEAIEAVQMFLDELFKQEVYLQVSLVDLCVDVAGWRDIDQLDCFEHFISRSGSARVTGKSEWVT